MEIPKINFSEDNWEYETKCRRCGNFTLWHFAPKIQCDQNIFFKYMVDLMQYPRSYGCEICKNNTIQDLTAHN